MANEKLYVNKAEGFVGTRLKKDEFFCDCSDIDDIIAFTKEGKMKIFKVSDKVFVGKDIIYVAVFKKNDERTTYNMIYTDGPKGITFIKRFNVTGVTRDKDYDLTKGTANSNVHWVTINPNGESTLGAEDYWFDDSTHRLNKEERGTYLGKFAGEDKILTITSKGQYKLYNYDLLNHFDEDIVMIEKFLPKQIITMIYFDGESKSYLAKRFIPENISTKTSIITEHENSLVELVTSNPIAVIDVVFGKEKDKQPKPEVINLAEFAPMVNMKAKGKKLTPLKVKEINLREAEEMELDEEPETPGDNGLSPMELHRRAMEKISRKAAQDFMKGEDGQGKLPFD